MHQEPAQETDIEEEDIEFYLAHFTDYRKCYCSRWLKRTEGFEHNGRIYCSKDCGLLKRIIQNSREAAQSVGLCKEAEEKSS
ncbi:MAG: hypothetical protein KKB21_04385 [Nanoarchaeota archaeon]|nr:hypothetical protein [Nanoarchaeota archaeon]MBU4086784.1 hypothetical protein [Nanoarchaeota archaeon]